MRKEMPGMTLETIAKACKGIYVGEEEQKTRVITGVVRDNREVEEGNLFVAIKGERVDGHVFADDAFARGAYAVLSEQDLKEAKGPYIRVNSTIEAMKRLAAFYRRSLHIKVVGITGSVGKTSTKEMIASVLSQKYQVLKTDGNYNNEIGLPLTIFRIRGEHQVAVLEMGISDFGEMHRLAEMANPDICVITNIGLCHLENLGTREGILNAKTECFEHMTEQGSAVLNGDDDMLCTRTVVNGRPAVFYGLGQAAKQAENGSSMAEKTVYATETKDLGFQGISLKVHTPRGDFSTIIPIPGEHNIYNALAATAVALKLDLTLEEIAGGIASVQTIEGRTNFLTIGEMTVIDDCYNANPVSMKASLSLLKSAKGRTIAVLGDMGELGADEKMLHRQVGQHAGQVGIDTIFASGTLAEEIVLGVKETNPNCQVRYFSDRESMTAALISYAKPQDCILVKASHFMEYPKVIEALKGAFQ